MLWRVLCFTLACNLQVIKNEAAYMNYPRRSDFAECELVTEEKEQFLDLHNKLRGMVNPTAADMEYLVRKNERIFTLVNVSHLRLCHSVQFFMASQSWLVAKQLALVTPVRCEVFAAKVLPKELFEFYFPQRFSQPWFEFFKYCLMNYLSCFSATFNVFWHCMMPSTNARFR